MIRGFEFFTECFNNQLSLGGLMSIRFWPMLVYISQAVVSQALVSSLFAGELKAVDEKKQEQEAAFVKMMMAFVKAEGLSGVIQPTYACQNGQEICGPVSGNLEEFLKKRPDFILD